MILGPAYDIITNSPYILSPLQLSLNLNHMSFQQVSSSESVASDMDLETHSASEVVTQQLSSKDSVGLKWVGMGWLDRLDRLDELIGGHFWNGKKSVSLEGTRKLEYFF